MLSAERNPKLAQNLKPLQGITKETTNQVQKNVFKILKWPPKNQNQDTPKTKTKQTTKTKTKPENKQQTNGENQVKITSLFKCKPSDVPKQETIKQLEPKEDQITLKLTLKPPTLVHK